MLKTHDFSSGEQCSLGVGYYTQLVWQNTTHVGCGWSQFQYRGFPVGALKWELNAFCMSFMLYES
jgi:hypothetical protein